MSTPLINGKAYAWASIRIELLGTVVMGVTAIEYEQSQEKKNNYGAGSEPVSRGYGNKEYKGSITLSMNEVEKIRAAIPGADKSLLAIGPFPIITQFTVGSIIKTHELIMCEFTTDKFGSKQGDTDIEQQFDLIIGGINYK